MPLRSVEAQKGESISACVCKIAPGLEDEAMTGWICVVVVNRTAIGVF